MSELLDQAIAKVRALPVAEQDAAAYALIDYLETRRETRLSDEQLAEVRRRRADPNAVRVSHEEARLFIDRLISQ